MNYYSQHSQLMLLDEGGPEVGVVGAAAFAELRVRLISAVLLKPAKRVWEGKACEKLVHRVVKESTDRQIFRHAAACEALIVGVQ